MAARPSANPWPLQLQWRYRLHYCVRFPASAQLIVDCAAVILGNMPDADERRIFPVRRGARPPWGVIAFALLLSAAWTLLSPANPASAAIPQSATYDVQIQGTVNGLPFARTGRLALGPTVTQATTNGINPVDLCLRSGSPFISPEAGAIWFATNGICVNANGARQDMAFVAVDRQASTISIRPDPDISATGINAFNGSSGYTAAIWQIFDGAMVLRFDGTGANISGTIDFLGTGAIYHSENRYIATLTGRATELTPSAGDIAPPAPPPTSPARSPTPPPTAGPLSLRTHVSRPQRLGPAVRVRVWCPGAACTATAGATVRISRPGRAHAKSYVLSKVTRPLGKGSRSTFALKLAPAIRKAIARALRARRAVLVSFRVVAVDAAGNKRTTIDPVRMTR